ncbi:TolC family protein, partial [bacterium]|nr:TolC family protein [bacterium]
VFFLPDFDNPSSGEVTPIEIGSDNSIAVGFTATQILFNSAVFTGVGTARIYQKSSRELYRAEYNRTVSNVKKAFYQVLLSQQIYETTKASMSNTEENFRNVKILNQQGIVSDYDLIRAEVQVENIRPRVIEAEQNVLVVTNALKILLGIDADTNVQVKGDLTLQEVDSTLLNAQTAVENNANLHALQYQKQVNREIASIRRSEFLPTISAFGNYQWQAQKNTFDFRQKDFVGTSQVGLSLSINLFNGFQTSARVYQAKIDELKVEQQVRYTRESIKTTLQSIALRLEEAYKRVMSQGRTVELAEKSYKIANTRYKTGSGTQLEVNDADLALLQARLNRIQAVYDYMITRVDLEEILSYHNPTQN